MSANDKGIVAVTGRAHCQRQVAFFTYCYQEHWQNEIHYKVHLSTLFPKRNATFHAAFLLKESVHGMVWGELLGSLNFFKEVWKWLFHGNRVGPYRSTAASLTGNFGRRPLGLHIMHLEDVKIDSHTV